MVFKCKGKLLYYSLADLLTEYNLTREELVKVCLMLGWESVPKTPRVGKCTVLARRATTALTEEQQQAFEFIVKRYSGEQLNGRNIKMEAKAFSNYNKYIELLNWLEEDKCFNRSRIEKAFKKCVTWPADE
jgi:hypothetical protein